MQKGISMYKVLIVEDEMLVSVGLRNMISWSAMDMCIIGDARNGKMGLELYHQKKPDLIITDIKMPVMDGLEMIREIRKQDSKTRIVVLSSYEDFPMVREAFRMGISDYILKLDMMPEEIENVIRKVQKELLEALHIQEENAMGKDISDINAEEEKMCKEARNYVISGSGTEEALRAFARTRQLQETSLYVCAMEILPIYHQSYVQRNDEDEEHKAKICKTIVDLLENVLSEYSQGIAWHMEGNQYALIFRPKEKDAGGKNVLLEELADRIQEILNSCMNMTAVFGVSSISDSFTQLPNLYKEAEYALKKACFLDEEMIVYGKEVFKNRYFEILEAFEQRLAEECENEVYQKKILQELSLLKTQKVPDSAFMKDVVIRWIHWVSYEENTQRKEGAEWYLLAEEKVRKAVSLEDMFGIFEEYVTARGVHNKENKTVSRELALAMAYIREHYMDPELSLPGVADIVCLHKDYLSKLFKRELGVGFSGYVMNIRIRQAKKLLRETQMKSYEIAQMIGFKEETYFSKVFKKIVGVRPNEYKRREWIDMDKDI